MSGGVRGLGSAVVGALVSIVLAGTSVSAQPRPGATGTSMGTRDAAAPPVESPSLSTLGSFVVADEGDGGATFVGAGSDAGAPPGQVPVGNVVSVGRRGAWKCSGVLIAPTLVLSARHCVPADSVFAGNDVHEPGPTAAIAKSELPSDTSVDLVLFKLATRLPFTPMGVRRAKDQAPPSGFVRLVGFGANVPGGGVGRKKQIDLNVFGWGCDVGRAQRLGCRPDAEMVIGWRSGKDTCDGDSGGPVFESTPDGFRLIAITSRAVRDAYERCGSGGVYTRVDASAQWLNAARQRLGGG